MIDDTRRAPQAARPAASSVWKGATTGADARWPSADRTTGVLAERNPPGDRGFFRGLAHGYRLRPCAHGQHPARQRSSGLVVPASGLPVYAVFVWPCRYSSRGVVALIAMIRPWPSLQPAGPKLHAPRLKRSEERVRLSHPWFILGTPTACHAVSRYHPEKFRWKLAKSARSTSPSSLASRHRHSGG